MTLRKASQSKDEFDRQYVSRKEGGRGLASIKDSIDASIQRIEDYIEEYKGLITAIRNDSDNATANRMSINRKKGEKKTTMDVLRTYKQHHT